MTKTNSTLLYIPDVILAHRLLKNSINDQEYILITDNIEIDQESLSKDTLDWVQIRQGQESYKNIGEIDYSFIPLKNLHEQMLEPSSLTFPGLSPEKILYECSIQAPVDLVYDNFTNLERRMEWNEDIKDIILQGKGLNQTGSVHTCLVGAYSLDIESIGRMEDEDQIVYGERLNEFKGLRDIISIFTFEKKDDQTHIRVEVDYKIKSWLGRLMKPWVRKMLQKQTEDRLQKLKKASEKDAH